ncbi:MAG: hypothetical protein Q7K44_02185 [Candidatus Liptonbacteria bacterium]|nr:hypothetical protein [Candidatus Liptonbacteria bacterium]
MKKNIFLFLLISALLMPAFSNADVKFQASQLPTPSGILENLPQPLNDFIKSAKDIGITAGNQFGKYINTSVLQGPVNVNLSQLKDINITQWFKDILQINSSNSIYQLAIKLLSSVGNLFISILNIIIDLIKQGLSFLR